MHKSVLLDTNFFLRFLNENDALFRNVDGYFRYFIQKDIMMMISTISIAEYCVGGEIQELPLRNLQILPFNIDHSIRAEEFAKVAFQEKKSGMLDLTNRNIIPNDAKLFAQADTEFSVEYYLSSNSESRKIYNLLKEKRSLNFQFIDLNTPYNEIFGLLDL